MDTAGNETAFDEDDSPVRPAVSPSAAPSSRQGIEFTEAEPKLSGTTDAIASRRGQKRRRRIFISIGVLAAALALGAYYLKFVAPYESTDDAFIAANVTPIAPQVAGRVLKLMVKDNQAVRKGEALLEIDPSTYRARLDQAKAGLAGARSRLAQARAQLTVDQARVGEAKANLVAAKAEATRAATDFKRYRAVGSMGVSKSQLDSVGTRATATASAVQVARNKELAAEALVGLAKANIETATAAVESSRAVVEQAALNLSYTRITAPEAGFITHRTVQAGAYVQPGQPLLAIVPRHVWVVANFKETQLTHMRPGQPVQVTVDAYPQIRFKGHVDSIQHGSGASFSLLPPENASGNFVKVVQRVPVKIVLDNVPADGPVLGPGMSVEPEVRVN